MRRARTGHEKYFAHWELLRTVASLITEHSVVWQGLLPMVLWNRPSAEKMWT
ncbi:hypothetical protein NY08_4064 [Rhodococcus sp. B7740]|nr:hypothetical protein NY08_4064 [Rhodococcus sp. B7740]